jgi:hypothetical protein
MGASHDDVEVGSGGTLWVRVERSHFFFKSVLSLVNY